MQEHLYCYSGQAYSKDTPELEPGRELRNGTSEVATNKKTYNDLSDKFQRIAEVEKTKWLQYFQNARAPIGRSSVASEVP